jgi:hypothetical protein
MQGVADPKLVTKPPANMIVSYSHSAVLRFIGYQWVKPSYAKLSQQTSLLGIREGRTATRKWDCSGSRNAIYKPREMGVERRRGLAGGVHVGRRLTQVRTIEWLQGVKGQYGWSSTLHHAAAILHTR